MVNKLFKHPLLNVIIILIITLLSIYGTTKVKSSNDIVDLVPKTNKVYVSDKKIKEIYNTGEVMIVGIKSKQGNILTLENLKTIDKITKAIEDIKLPQIQKKEEKESKESEKSQQEEDVIDYSNLLEDMEEGTVSFDDTQLINKQIFDSVNSITNIEQIEGVDGGLAPVKLEKYIPTNEKELKLFKEKLLSWDLFQDTIYSKDFSASSILITFPGDSDEDYQIIAYKEVEKVVNKLKNDDMEILFAGKPVMKSDAINYIKRDLVTLIPIVIIVVFLVLLFSLKRMRNVLLSLLTVCIATIWVVGLMGIFGIKFTLIGTILPVILIAVGTAYGIHVLTHYIEDKDEIKEILTKDENKTLILGTVKKVAYPVFLTALTTFFGFLSLLSVNIIPIKEFGVLTGIGVIIEFILSIIFIPSVLILLGQKKEKQNYIDKRKELLSVEKILMRLIKSLKNKKKEILVFTVLLIFFLIFGASRIKMNLDTMKYFRKNSNIVKSTKYINDNFSGADTIYINIIGKEDGDLTKSEILKFMEEFGVFMMKEHEVIGKVVGFNDMIKKMNQVMHYPDSDEYKKFISSSITYEDLFDMLNSASVLTGHINPEAKDIINEIKKKYNVEGSSFYEIPLDPEKYNINENDVKIYADQNELDYNSLTVEEKYRIKKEILGQLVSQYLVLYSGDMDEMIAVDQIKPRMAKLTITLKETTGDELASIKRDIEKYTKKNIPEGYTVEIGGTAMIVNELNSIVVNGQVYSFLISILIVFIIVSISFKSMAAGSIAIVPLTVSILTNFAIMGFFKLELNIATTMIASLTTGMGIDYAIHFLTFYKNNWKIYHDVDKAIEMTFLTTGKAILYNAFSVGLGFAVLLLSSLVILGVFGILITLTMLTSAFGALIFIPMLIELFKPKFADK